MTHRLPTFFTSTALVLALYPDLKGVFFFFSQAIFCLLYFIPPIHTLSLLFAWLETHPPIAWICWHTNIVFRKQNNPGNNAGIWKWVISLDGWVSNPWAGKQGRERERERVPRSTVHFAKARWRGQLWMLHAPSACQAVTCTQHADAITSACLYSSGQSELYVLFPHLTLSIFFNLLLGLRQSLWEGQTKSRLVCKDLTSTCLRVLERNHTGCPGC